MGYRELLKRYIRFVESQAGDDFIDSVAYVVGGPFSDRELGELRALTVERTTDDDGDCARLLAFSYRFRLLCIAFDLKLGEAATLAGVDVATARHWRANPLSTYYVAMQQAEFDRFERALVDWLAARHDDADTAARRAATQAADVQRTSGARNALS